MEILICKGCDNKFNQPPNSKYKRKYCNKCSKKIKKIIN